MLNDDFARQLADIPDVEQAIDELFKGALAKNEQRFYLCVLDLSRIEDPERPLLLFDHRRRFVIQQFWDFLQNTLVSPTEFAASDQQSFIRRLHMLAYSQFWESKGIQRLLLSLVLTAYGQEYEPNLLLGNHARHTRSVYEEIIAKSSKLGLRIGHLLTTIYNNQIRNAFSHSEIWEASEFIILENHDFKDEKSITSLRFQTWETLFNVTKSFMDELLSFRSDATLQLKQNAPYTVSLPEFLGPFTIVPDERGGWRFVQ